MVLFAGAAVVLAARSYRHRGARVLLRLAGLTCWAVLGATTGPENVVSFRTERYDAHPTVVSGPGAGAAVTAAGMTGDLLRLASILG